MLFFLRAYIGFLAWLYYSQPPGGNGDVFLWLFNWVSVDFYLTVNSSLSVTQPPSTQRASRWRTSSSTAIYARGSVSLRPPPCGTFSSKVSDNPPSQHPSRVSFTQDRVFWLVTAKCGLAGGGCWLQRFILTSSETTWQSSTPQWTPCT